MDEDLSGQKFVRIPSSNTGKFSMEKVQFLLRICSFSHSIRDCMVSLKIDVSRTLSNLHQRSFSCHGD